MISITLEEIVEKARVNGEAAHWLYWYARNVIKGRWPEEYIMKG